jgi:hypothetical protein
MRLLPILLLMFSCMAFGQELNNPNKLPVCDYSPTSFERNGAEILKAYYSKWDKCWGAAHMGGEYGIRTYKGEWLRGAPSGVGEIEFQNGGRFSGGIIQGKGNGPGKYFYDHGDFYEGEFRNGLFHGYGKLTKKSGTIFEGQWENDKFIQQAKVNSANKVQNSKQSKFIVYQNDFNSNFWGPGVFALDGARIVSGAGEDGSSAAFFDGDYDGLILTNQDLNFGTNDFDLSFKMRADGSQDNFSVLISRHLGGDYQIGKVFEITNMGMPSSGSVEFAQGKQGFAFSNKVNINDGAWHQIKISRIGNVVIATTDGVHSTSSSISPSTEINLSGMRIARWQGNNSNDNNFKGYIDDILVTRSSSLLLNADRGEIEPERHERAEERRRLEEETRHKEKQAATDRERQQLAEERRRLEEEKRKQQAENANLNKQNENSNLNTDNRRRFALVIGNSNYSSLPRLPNAINDARVITQSLRAAGFQVSTHENLDLAGMRNAIRVFGEKLSKNDVGLVYYAGHGVQVKGINYLIPIKENIKKSFEVPSSAVDVDFVLATLEHIKNDLNIVVLDACRSSFPGEARGTNRGLATIEAAKGTFIAFSTAPGKEALDGSGANSPYTKHLSRLIGKKGLHLEQVFKEVRKAVVAETNGEQVPWENSSLMGDFYFQK